MGCPVSMPRSVDPISGVILSMKLVRLKMLNSYINKSKKYLELQQQQQQQQQFISIKQQNSSNSINNSNNINHYSNTTATQLRQQRLSDLEVVNWPWSMRHLSSSEEFSSDHFSVVKTGVQIVSVPKQLKKKKKSII